jgi:hypothetical protein
MGKGYGMGLRVFGEINPSYLFIFAQLRNATVFR